MGAGGGGGLLGQSTADSSASKRAKAFPGLQVPKWFGVTNIRAAAGEHAGIADRSHAPPPPSSCLLRVWGAGVVPISREGTVRRVPDAHNTVPRSRALRASRFPRLLVDGCATQGPGPVLFVCRSDMSPLT